MNELPAQPGTRTVPIGNRFDRMEWAGAFGDLGTLIPFVAAYITVLTLDPFGVLFAFGASMVVCGLYYKTPFPVQPMKAIGAAAAVQAAQVVITPGAVYAAGLVTGIVWLALGLTGFSSRVAKVVPASVVAGIVLGLGFGFMLEGVKMIQTDWLVAGIGGIATLLLLGNRKFPAMFALLVFGAAVGVYRSPDLLAGLARSGVGVRTPEFALGSLSWNDLWIGAVLLALPQVPLTLGNALIAIKKENNELFPHVPVTEKKISISTGLMNLFSSSVGGVPMCHGAGGMAGHVAFGARTGGAVVILGVLLLVLAVFFSGSVELLFRLFPSAVLGVILFLAGAQLALGAGSIGETRAARMVVLATAAFCMWNVAVGFLVGVALHHLQGRGLLRL